MAPRRRGASSHPGPLRPNAAVLRPGVKEGKLIRRGPRSSGRWAGGVPHGCSGRGPRRIIEEYAMVLSMRFACAEVLAFAVA